MLERLDRERKKLEGLRPPEDMEDRLLEALDVRRPRIWPRLAGGLIILGLTMGYQSNTIADLIQTRGEVSQQEMSKYRDLAEGNLKKLMDSDYFQPIGRRVQLGNSDYLTIEGLVLTETGVNVFTTSGGEDFLVLKLRSGSKSQAYTSSQARAYGGREYKNYQVDLEIDQGQDRLELEFIDGEGTSFLEEVQLDMTRMVRNTEKIRLGKKLRLEGDSYRLNYLLINPRAIVVRGSSENSLDLIYRYFTGGDRPGPIELGLEINSRPYSFTGANFKTDLSGSSFEFSFNDFDMDIESLELLVFNRQGEEVSRIKVK